MRTRRRTQRASLAAVTLAWLAIASGAGFAGALPLPTTGGDGGASCGSAAARSVGEGAFAGQLQAPTFDDWLRFEVREFQTVRAEVDVPLAYQRTLVLELYDVNCALVVFTIGTGAIAYATADALVYETFGDWTLRVSVSSPTCSSCVVPYTGTLGVSYGRGIDDAVSPRQSDPGADGKGDAPDSFDAAARIPPGQHHGTLAVNPRTDLVDWFRIHLDAGVLLSVELQSNAISDYDVQITDPTGRAITRTVAPHGANDTATIVAHVSGDWRIAIFPYVGRGPYAFDLHVWPWPANDAGSGTDAANTLDGALPLDPGQHAGTLGRIPAPDNEDHYAIDASLGDTVRATLTPPPGADFDVYLIDPENATVDSSTRGGDASDSVEFRVDIAGSWRIRVHRYDGAGNYTLDVARDPPPPQADAGQPGDAGDTFDAARAIAPGTHVGEMTALPPDPADFFRFEVAPGERIDLALRYLAPEDNLAADFDLVLWSPTGEPVTASRNFAGDEAIRAVAHLGGSWRAEVTREVGEAGYALDLALAAPLEQHDAGEAGDAGDTFETARRLHAGLHAGRFQAAPVDAEDWYKVALVPGDRFEVAAAATSGAARLNLSVVSPSGRLVTWSDAPTHGAPAVVSLTAAEAGDWRLRLTTRASPFLAPGYEEYQARLRLFLAERQDDGGSGADAGDTMENATRLRPGAWQGTLGARPATDAEDWFAVEMPEGGRAAVTMQPPTTSDFHLEVYAPDGRLATFSRFPAGSPDVVRWEAAAAGTWFVRVVLAAGEGDYDLALDLR